MEKNRSDIQYVRYNYRFDGNAARKLEAPAPKRNPLPKAPPVRKPAVVIRLDPLAICAVALSVVMLALMLAGLVQMGMARAERERTRQYLWALEERSAALTQRYEESYDLQNVKKTAEALGMVPREALEHVPVTVSVAELPQEPTLWERVSGFFAGLFG